MTAVVAAGLLTLALLDGAFSGFRSSLGRNGLIRHGDSDRIASTRGVVLLSVLLIPTIACFVIDVLVRSAPIRDYQRAGEAALIVFVPYAGMTFVALAGYAFLGWRQKYLASALILGPFTLLRPLVIAVGALFGILRVDDASVATAILLAATAVLAIEPLSGHRWYASAPE